MDTYITKSPKLRPFIVSSYIVLFSSIILTIVLAVFTTFPRDVLLEVVVVSLLYFILIQFPELLIDNLGHSMLDDNFAMLAIITGFLTLPFVLFYNNILFGDIFSLGVFLSCVLGMILSSILMLIATIFIAEYITLYLNEKRNYSPYCILNPNANEYFSVLMENKSKLGFNVLKLKENDIESESELMMYDKLFNSLIPALVKAIEIEKSINSHNLKSKEKAELTIKKVNDSIVEELNFIYHVESNINQEQESTKSTDELLSVDDELDLILKEIE